MSEKTQAVENRQYITFIANGQEFAADIMAIREIRGWTDTTSVPHAPDFVRGIINLRGSVLPVIDLKARLGLGLTDATVKHVIIVVSDGSRASGLLVEAVSDIMTLSGADVQPPPDIMRSGEDNYVEGIVVIDNRLVTLLGIASIMKTVPSDIDLAA